MTSAQLHALSDELQAAAVAIARRASIVRLQAKRAAAREAVRALAGYARTGSGVFVSTTSVRA